VRSNRWYAFWKSLGFSRWLACCSPLIWPQSPAAINDTPVLVAAAEGWAEPCGAHRFTLHPKPHASNQILTAACSASAPRKSPILRSPRTRHEADGAVCFTLDHCHRVLLVRCPTGHRTAPKRQGESENSRGAAECASWSAPNMTGRN
jgi:hypothetical protein